VDPRLAVLDRTPPPAPLDLVTGLLDTWFGRTDSVATHPDEGLRTPADLAGWCRAHGTDVADDAVGEDDLALARTVRAGLRSVLARHTEPDVAEGAEETAARARLDEAAAGLRVRARVAVDPPRLEPEEGGVRGLLALAVTAPLAVDARTWSRLKACREPRCRTAFYDASRNGSGVWCSMGACGAAAKQPAFVERRRARREGARS
jgi:predicted RNA-binding Zn ribbon-like protein